MERRIPQALVLGILVPIAPMFGSHWAMLLTVLYLLSKRALFPNRGYLAQFPLLMIYLGWAVSDLIFNFDAQTLESIFGHSGVIEGLNRLYEFLFLIPSQGLHTVSLMLTLYLSLTLFIFLSNHKNERLELLHGIQIGLTFATLVALYQFSHIQQIVTPNQNQFWLALHRLPGTFTDPNAYGIVCLLVLGLGTVAFDLERRVRQKLVVVVSTLLFVQIGLLSQSRTLILGVVLYLVTVIVLSRRRLGALLGIGVVGVVVALIAFRSQISLDCPQLLTRMCDTLTTRSGNNSLESRQVFSQIAFAIFKENFLFGVGLGHFDQLVPVYSQRLGFATGAWLDNANNFYLGLLAETGLVGFLAFCLSVRSFHLRSTSRLIHVSLQALIITFGLVLLTGPHLNFFEVSFFFIVVLSFGCALTPRAVLKHEWYLLAICLLGIAVSSCFSQRGLYPVEKDGSRLFAWTQRTATVSRPCHAGGVKLTVRALNPDLKTAPLKVNFAAGGVTSEVSLTNTDYVTVEFPCFVRVADGSERTENAFVQISVSRVWIPKRYGLGLDPRPLGVQLMIEEPAMPQA